MLTGNFTTELGRMRVEEMHVRAARYRRAITANRRQVRVKRGRVSFTELFFGGQVAGTNFGLNQF
ncbi:MAG: hypothetical protein M3P18_17110 [Actinomycetota bacterium]|nr:hypothetical protein [Actinomycetota bacterium]